MNRTQLFTYGLDSRDEKALRRLCREKNIRLRTIRPEETALPLGVLTGRLSAGSLPAGGAPEPEEDSAALLLFADFGAAQLDMMLSSLRTARIAPDSLRAILTEYNERWSTRHLLAELRREREAAAQ